MSNEVKTKEKIDMDPKYIVKLTVTLLGTCLIVALLLGLVNGVTAGPIAEINQQKTEAAMLAVVSDPDNTTFSDALELSGDMTAAATAAGGTLNEMYEVQVNGEAAGYAVKVTASGSQGSIEMMVGVDAEGAVTGVSVVNHSETSGIGTKVVGNEPTASGVGVLDQFIGKSAADGTLTVGTNVDAITGATVHQGCDCRRECGAGCRGCHGLRREEQFMNLGKQFKEGLITNNPVLVQVLGMCSTMAITTSFFNGLGMGVAVTVILTLSNVIIAAIRKIVPDKIRIAMFIVVIAGFVTCVDLLIQAFVPALSESLGVFIPLIVVNCIILGRAESFSYKNGVAASFWDGIFQGFGYTVVLMVMCIIREFLGAGTFGGGILNGGDGIQILPEQFPIGMLTLPVGGFLVLGCLIALMQWALSRPKKNKEESK